MRALVCFIYAAFTATLCDAFVVAQHKQSARAPAMTMTKSDVSPRSVRAAFTKTVAATAVAYSALFGAGVGLPLEAARAADTVTVLGSGGKTGKLIVEYLTKKGIDVKPTSYRTGTDVTKIDSLAPALTGARAVIFAASASKDGGKADAVDYKGVENVAKECVRLKVRIWPAWIGHMHSNPDFSPLHLRLHLRSHLYPSPSPLAFALGLRRAPGAAARGRLVRGHHAARLVGIPDHKPLWPYHGGASSRRRPCYLSISQART